MSSLPWMTSRTPLACVPLAALACLLSLPGCSTKVDYGSAADPNGETPDQATEPASQDSPLTDAPPFDPSTDEETATEPADAPPSRSAATPFVDPPPATPAPSPADDPPVATSAATPTFVEAAPSVKPEVLAPEPAEDRSPSPELADDPLISGGLFAGLPGFDDSLETNSRKADEEELEEEEEVIAVEVPPAEPVSDVVQKESPVPDTPEPAGIDTSFLAELLPEEPEEAEPLTESEPPPPEPEAPAAHQPIPLDPQNTRHLAWLLGAKSTVVALADLAGVPGAHESQAEVNALADLLKVSRPGSASTLAESDSTKSAVAQLIRQSRITAQELTRQHGPDHAALMEIALKTNALLVLYESRPSLAKPVRAAVETASKRAKLPAETLRPLTAVLDGEADSEKVQKAVHSAHREIERLLRDGG